MTRAQKRKIVIIVVLVVLLALLALYYVYYQNTRKLTFDITPVSSAVIDPPQYLYQFSAVGGQDRLQRPIGVLVDDPEVFVADSIRRKIDVFNESGQHQRSFGGSETITPLYIAKHPKTGELYVSDRRTRSIHIYNRAGKYLRDFDPKLPKEQLPTFESQGIQWAPVAIAFAPDGTMYVTEILKGHRLLIFGPDGKFKKSVGNAGAVTNAKTQPEVFLFPNGVTFYKNKVYVTDSNNRRIQVFDKNGKYERIVVTEGLPRGIAFLKRFPQDEEKTPDRYVTVDTLAHDGTIWATNDEKILNFGQQGVLEGQFNYPNGVSVLNRNNKIFVSDTANGRMQVWGWPEQASPIPIPKVPQRWYLCLLPLLLLPLLLLLRRQKFFSTQDFIDNMIESEELDLLPHRRRKWFVTPELYEHYHDLEHQGIKLAELLHEVEHSESDTKALQDKLEIDFESARILSIAQRMKVFTTEDLELRRLAKLLEVDVIDRVEFLERYAKRTEQTGQAGEE